MTGYQSKKDMAQDKMAHMTFEQRCRLSEQCLPEAPYREMLTKLHDEMLKALEQRTWVGLSSVDFNDFNPLFAAEEAARWADAKLKEKNNG